VRDRADALIDRHLGTGWTFAFDRAVTRAGLCDHTRRRISVSAPLAARYSEAEVEQVLLHEVAHALAGAGAGHGPTWRTIARGLGYTGDRLHDGRAAEELAPWVGECPGGHPLYRHRRPTRPVACGRCTPRFDPAYLVTWTRRDMGPRSPTACIVP
jgi:hypothetical protein